MTLPDGVPTPGAFCGPSLPQSYAMSDYPTSFSLSDLRTGSKRKRESLLSTPASLQSDQDLERRAASETKRCLGGPSESASEDVCVDCVVDCDDADCQAYSEEKCTDKCIVIPCNDQNACPDACIEDTCQAEPCDGGADCTASLDDSLRLLCCTDYHNYYAPTDINSASCQLNWDCTLDSVLTMDGSSESTFPGYSQFLESNRQITSTPSITEIPCDSSNGPVTFQENSVPGSSLTTRTQTELSAAMPRQTSSHEFPCRWLSCNASFSSLNELVGHVNLTHLRPPSSPQPPAKKLCLDSTVQDIFSLSCRWDDCHIYPDASTLPGPSSGLQPEMAFDLLTNHLFQDHLGLSVPPQAPSVFHDASFFSDELREKVGTSFSASGNAQTLQTVEPSYATPEPSPPPSSVPCDASHTHDCATASHICHWKGCGASFETCAALTDHLAAAHVGGGKGRYDCYWGDCARSGAQGFTSKQKIMRHLQAHTGHRPFMCSECGQHFSEAATLQQHMRRHTQEKPFVCDFPGCGKAFAITGALTIHKRTHNGERPFQCPHCTKAFAESSNLSKHLRTHTGDRPYRCTEPGCGKAFARPDQLQRHGNVHTKKKVAETGSAQSIVVKISA